LLDGTWAAGRIARRGTSETLGYFFGPRRPEPPGLADLASLSADWADHVGRFSDLAIKSGDWPVLGGHDDFDRVAWPVPDFGTANDRLGIYERHFYDDTLKLTRSARVPPDEARSLRPDVFLPDLALQIRLTRLLGGTVPPKESRPATSPRIDHFLSFPRRALAAAAARSAQALGFETEVERIEGRWVLRASRDAPADIEDDADELERIADEHGGGYEGMERDVGA
jgi:hypothetical protein